jgi:4-hydroxy 2-oxovalerate aldolase
MKYKILDCTLRDGGYYNLWKFSPNQISEYLDKLHQSKIDIIEIGFRFLKTNSKYGHLAYSKESFLNKLQLKKKNIEYAVMLNSSDLISIDNDQDILKKNFPNKRESFISIVRIACQYDHIPKIIKSLNFLKKNGYKIAINLMQIHIISPKNLRKILRLLNNLDINYFYFADSFGSIRPHQIKEICKNIKNVWKKSFGIHAHDNCGYALSNTLEAYKNGASLLDSTILGMGRGAGNAKTEQLVTEMNFLNKSKYKSKPIYNLTNNLFKKLHEKYNWGSSIFYHLAANKNIHPSYIQELLVDDRYNHEEILNIIDFLSKNKSIYSYNSALIKKINVKNNFKIKKLAKSWAVEKKVLIVGQGKSVLKNQEKIKNFIKKNNCVVLSLNINKYLKKKLIDYYVVSHSKRISIDQNKYTSLKKIILPYNYTKNYLKIVNKKNKNTFFTYELNIKKNVFNIGEKNCTLPNDNVVGFAVALCHFGDAKKIYLAGFDGYNNNDELQLQSENYLKFLTKKSKYKLNFITKKNYKL